jgi:hypothetical protein
MRDTSIEAYRAIRDSDLFGKKLFSIYDALFYLGPCTANELGAKMEHLIFAGVIQTNLQSGLNHLVKTGSVVELDKRKCSITNRRVLVYDVTAKLPKQVISEPAHKCPHCRKRLHKRKRV